MLGELKLPQVGSTESTLVWYPSKYYGYYPVDQYWKENNLTEEGIYGQAYFDKYVGYKNQETGVKLNKLRYDFVEETLKGKGYLLDVGIGSGDFVSNDKRYFGYDVNPVAVTWLKNKSKYVDLYRDLPGNIEAFTFWDSFEHIKQLDTLLKITPKYIFMSIPMFKNMEHVLMSKHYRPDEHYWYFTIDGLLDLMQKYNYTMIEMSKFEESVGRESISSFAFEKN